MKGIPKFRNLLARPIFHFHVWEEGYLEPDFYTYFFVFVAPWSLMLDQDLVVGPSPPAWQSGEGSTIRKRLIYAWADPFGISNDT